MSLQERGNEGFSFCGENAAAFTAAKTMHVAWRPRQTADPGFIAHWSFPARLSKESVWLAYYVSLSRPRSFKNLLSHGLPDRNIIEGGPPKTINDAVQDMFGAKIVKTRLACVQARAEMGWRARPS